MFYACIWAFLLAWVGMITGGVIAILQDTAHVTLGGTIATIFGGLFALILGILIVWSLE